MHKIGFSGSIVPNSNAARATKGLKVEPGEYRPAIDLFTKGFKGSSLISPQSLCPIPWVNLFGSYVGEEAIAITSPV